MLTTNSPQNNSMWGPFLPMLGTILQTIKPNKSNTLNKIGGILNTQNPYQQMPQQSQMPQSPWARLLMGGM